MTKIEATINPLTFEEVKDRLREIGVTGMTVSEVRGHGCTLGRREIYGGVTYVLDFVTKVRLDMVVVDSIVDKVIEALMVTARRGDVGDGRIFITTVEDTVRIRTGERGDEAT